MTRIWRYVVKTDGGMAPHIANGMLSLACCKPLIRKHARKGDWVIGFAPKRSGRGHVIWAGRISDQMTLGEYQLRFPERRDAVYRRTGFAVDGTEILESLRPDYHAAPELRRRDWRGQNALIFDLFTYTTGGAPAPGPIAGLAHYHIGQSARGSSPELAAALERWVRRDRHAGVISPDPGIRTRSKSLTPGKGLRRLSEC